jgi:hypothetical protein
VTEKSSGAVGIMDVRTLISFCEMDIIRGEPEEGKTMV